LLDCKGKQTPHSMTGNSGNLYFSRTMKITLS